MKLSIVATLYQSAPYIDEFCNRSGAIAQSLFGKDYEIILVNDGSPDESLEVALQISKNNSHITVVDLSRNFGHHKAMMTGLSHCSGELVYLIDSDLEEDPEWLTLFYNEMTTNDWDVVYGVQNCRKGGIFERISGEIFHKSFKALTGLKMTENFVTARLMTKRYVESLVQHKERELMIGGLWEITGYSQCPIVVKKHCSSQTTYSLSKKIQLFVNSITAFSSFPLVAIFYFGFLISFLSFTYAGFLILNWILFSTPLTGWTSVITSIWLLGGLIILFIGVIGVYLAKVFSETKQRPYVIIRKIYGKNK
ncbi:glycosyltransferase family 2 protein [Desulfovibrio sp. JC010]|uniref:glycosyltransferase family 2 protein n=1 Tax=Desulfovibrio sp. JC010 TaxID=2593641 RepID=UPI0013D59BBC|nr:glycosyltransferase family 2 protein [Desulfovibrio sp. JC010]NDV27167.1 glycosyltransferase family 2 protein [Desulfovibrio sp. JC010]